MGKCIFCGSITSFKFDGDGKYKGEVVCPKCQSERLETNFNTGCANKGKVGVCSIKSKK